MTELLDVHLLELPVPLWSKSQQQTDDLLREFALASAGDQDAHHLPARLTRLIDALTADFEGVASEQEEQLFAAAAAGEPVLPDLGFRVPAAVGPACVALGDMLDEADEYCREGKHLLTLASDDDVVMFRRWYLTEFVRQVAGEEPLPWPAYERVTQVSSG